MTCPFTLWTSVSYSVAVQGDGKIIAAGRMTDLGTDVDVALARFAGGSFSLFADDFESGDASEWSSVTP